MPFVALVVGRRKRFLAYPQWQAGGGGSFFLTVRARSLSQLVTACGRLCGGTPRLASLRTAARRIVSTGRSWYAVTAAEFE
jgi:hypothetical protein